MTTTDGIHERNSILAVPSSQIKGAVQASLEDREPEWAEPSSSSRHASIVRLSSPVRDNDCARPLPYRNQQAALRQFPPSHLRPLRLIQISNCVSGLRV